MVVVLLFAEGEQTHLGQVEDREEEWVDLDMVEVSVEESRQMSASMNSITWTMWHLLFL